MRWGLSLLVGVNFLRWGLAYIGVSQFPVSQSFLFGRGCFPFDTVFKGHFVGLEMGYSVSDSRFVDFG